ncbi:hypothetical protein M8J77_014536 [Diaphorina citri]|nr:hypothetical protein M8J77_014536 [Diaphorina citri]
MSESSFTKTLDFITWISVLTRSPARLEPSLVFTRQNVSQASRCKPSSTLLNTSDPRELEYLDNASAPRATKQTKYGSTTNGAN